jgi:hypothetical protein
MNILRRLFGGRSDQIEEPKPDNSSVDEPPIPAAASVAIENKSISVEDDIENVQGASIPQLLKETLLATRENGLKEYLEDRDESLLNYRRQSGLPEKPYSALTVRWYEELALKAGESSLWSEAWGFWHHTLSAYITINNEAAFPSVLGMLGRTHMGLRKAKLATLYLQSAHALFRQGGSVVDAIVVGEHLAASILFHDDTIRKEQEAELQRINCQGKAGSEEVRKSSVDLWRLGIKEVQWRNQQDQPYAASQQLGRAYLKAGIVICELQGNAKGLANCYRVLADSYRLMNEKEEARLCFEKSIQAFQQCGDKAGEQEMTAWLQKL